MKNYRLVEVYPEDGKRNGKKVRNVIYNNPDKEGLKKAVLDWCHAQYGTSEDNTKRKPWADYVTYHGARRIYPYEI